MTENTPAKPISTSLIITIVLVLIVAVLTMMVIKEHGSASKYKKQCKAHKKEIRNLSSANYELTEKLNDFPVVIKNAPGSDDEDAEEEEEDTNKGKKKNDKSK